MSDQEHLMNSLKKEVRSLLTPVKEGLTPFQLEQEYRWMIGEQFPYRALGYQSVMELVKEMPDVVNVCPRGDGGVILKAIADESTKGIASLVAKQKSKPKAQPSRHRPNLSLHSTPRPVVLWHPIIPANLLRRGRVPPILPAVVKSDLKELLTFSPVLLSDFDKAFLRHFGRTFEFLRYGFFSMFEVLNAASDIITVVQTRAGSLLTLKKSPSPRKPPEKVPECKVVTQPDKATFQTSPAAVPTPVLKTSSPTPALPVDNQSPIPNWESETALVPLKRMETPLVRPDEKISELEKEMKIALAEKGPGGTVSSELKEKIKIIVAQHPEGLLASKLPGEFKLHFKETLPVKMLGFLTLMEFVGALSDVLHIEHKEGEQDWLIFDSDSQRLTNADGQTNLQIAHSLACEETPHECKMPSWDSPLEDSKNLQTKFNVVTKMKTPHLGLEEPHIMQEIMEEEIPPDAALDRRLYSLPQFSNSTLVGLFVEYILSPSQFYVRIYSAETSDKLEDMMVEMRRCYSSKNVADRYVMPEAWIRPGHLCCVRNLDDKWWYRVIIHQVLNDQEVEVFYPDFGNMETVHKSSLRFLKYCYTTLPAQAIPCSLGWVKPTEGDWTADAVLEFQRLCRLKLLVGVVDEYIDGVLYLFLCDTSHEEDIYFHSVLRLEGHALICRENIPSKGFKELNPSAWYIQSIPKEEAALTEPSASLLQEELLGSPPGEDSEVCENDTDLQRLHEKGEDLARLQLDQLEQGHNCFADSSNCSCDFKEKGHLKACPENASLEQNEQMLKASKDSGSLCSNLEMPYLEPVYLCKEIWDENWIPSKYYEEKKKDDSWDNLCSDTAENSCQAAGDEGSKDETRHSQDAMPQDADVSGTVDRMTCLHLEPLSQFPQSSEGTETSPPGTAPDALPQTLEEFYVSISHSKKSGESDEIDLDASKLFARCDQPPPSASALHGEASLEKKGDDSSRAQALALYRTTSRPDDGTVGCNALVFTAELQGASKFCVPCSTTVALGASARLAASNRYFFFNLLRNMKA
ncbi:tudor domain-containing protein 5 isoform X1 [Varanus komodoensis]|uniref:tudor domain-containing protein 5 isoform X1 n=1 Tax=Varanus komodoensis TaxID=61221 RepID=UPI001CF787D4|nr:tudor domain-containing protein 5 isoform X1 [Varanus komodoensis]